MRRYWRRLFVQEPEKLAGETIDKLHLHAGGVVCDPDKVNFRDSRGVAIRELPIKQGYSNRERSRN